MVSAIFAVIEDEKKRISGSKLANKEQWSLFFKPIRAAIIKGAEKSRDWRSTINQLANLHNLLKTIKLPGDFEKYASDEKFYVALDLPYEGEQLYDLSSLLKGKGARDENEDEKEEEEEKNEERHSDECMLCTESDNSEQILAIAVNKYLTKIAHELGNNGNHEAAYLVERTIQKLPRN